VIAFDLYFSTLCRAALGGTMWSFSNAMNTIGARSSFVKSTVVGALRVKVAKPMSKRARFAAGTW
jgi:hypothetical protein